MNRKTAFLSWPGCGRLSFLLAVPNIGIVLLMFSPILPASDQWQLDIPGEFFRMLSVIGVILGLVGIFFHRLSRWLTLLALVLNIIEIIFIPSFGRA
jgi:hypothetical protein